MAKNLMWGLWYGQLLFAKKVKYGANEIVLIPIKPCVEK
jgi:hypothetical protein